jgi:hypothetical protein
MSCLEQGTKDKFCPLTRKHTFYQTSSEADINGDSRSRIDPVLKLYYGCELMLTDNIDVAKGLANGTRGFLQNVVLKQNETYHKVYYSNDISIKAVFASAVDYVILQHVNSSIQPRTFAIKPQQNQLEITLNFPLCRQRPDTSLKPKPSLVEMKTIQLPLVSNSATTVHKLQGTGVEKLFVFSFCYRKNCLYVVLSRVKQLSGLILAKKIDSDLQKYALAPDLIALIDLLLHLVPSDIDYSYFNIPNPSPI